MVRNERREPVDTVENNDVVMLNDIVSPRPDLYSLFFFAMPTFVATFDPCRHAASPADRSKPCCLARLSVRYDVLDPCALRADALFEQLDEFGYSDFKKKLAHDLTPDATVLYGAALVAMANDIRRRHVEALKNLEAEWGTVIGVGSEDEHRLPISLDPACYIADAARWFLTVASLNSGVTSCR